MCGRYSLGRTDRLDWGRLGVKPRPRIAPRWNIAPGTQVVAIRETRNGREAVELKWGLVPHWARDPSMGSRMANARSESAAERPAFRDAFRARRCLLPADGFFEWQAVSGAKRRRPWRAEPTDGGILALGGLWESWLAPTGPLETCTILTVPANATLAPIHDRMPVLVAPYDYDAWLSPRTPQDAVRALCVPAPEGELRAWRVSTAVNDANNDTEAVATLLNDNRK